VPTRAARQARFHSRLKRTLFTGLNTRCDLLIGFGSDSSRARVVVLITTI